MADTDTDEAQSTAPLTGWWGDFRTAAGFLTRLPMGAKRGAGAPPRKGDLARAVRAFPLVGLVVGLLAALAYLIADGLNLPPFLASLIAVGVMIIITGALHEDGLADVADAFLDTAPRTEKLKIMRDSRIGVYGASALVIALGLRVGALAAIAEAGQVAAALIATANASRAALPALMYRMKPARRGGLAAAAGKPDQSQVLLTLLLGAALALFFLNFLIQGFPGLMAGVIVLIIGSGGVFGIATLARRAIGGYTGDVLGAAQQTMEIAMLLAIVAII